MPGDTVEERARKALEELDQSPRVSPVGQRTLPLAVIALVAACLAMTWIGDQLKQQRGRVRPIAPPEAVRLAAVQDPAGGPFPYVVVHTGTAGRDDLFLCTSATTVTCQNLTESPGLAEVWPVVDPDGQQVAYYGIGETETDLQVLTLPSGAAMPLTVHAGESGLHDSFEITPTSAPAFSPDGAWLAFPAQDKKTGAVELFVARDDGQTVRRITELGYQVRDYIWLDNDVLAFVVRWPDGTLHRWRARREGDEFQLEALP